jgi:hypothetical protein
MKTRRVPGFLPGRTLALCAINAVPSRERWEQCVTSPVSTGRPVNLVKRDRVIVNASKCGQLRERGGDVMRKSLLAAAIFAGAIGVSTAQADTVGAVAGAGTGLLVAGPPGAVVGGVVGAVWGKPFWGPSISKGHCWTDNSFHRHCNRHW